MPRTNAQPPSQPSLLDDPRPGSNLPEFSVSEISKLLKRTVEETFGQVRVRGEISGLKVAPSGHVYFDLKDQEAVLASVCWKGQAGKLGLKLENGMEIICTGRLTTYMMRSNYQLVVERAALAGMGALLKMLEERKKRLEAEGLFDPARKQLLPYLPEVIGVVTSPTGAVIRDILHRLQDRFPRRVLVWPVLVQGEGAAQQITAAIEGFNNLPEQGPVPRPDLLIVARGGGSVEDLMPFNDEAVVRAAAASNIPLISAVGHETDTTLIDFASDVRAPTPTAAAEMAVPVREDLLEQIIDDGRRLWDTMRRMLQDRFEHLGLLSRALGDPLRAIEPLLQRLDEKTERLALAWQSNFERRMARVMEAAGKLRHPRDILQLAKQRLDYLDHKIQSGWREGFLRKQNRLETLGTVLGHLSPKAVLGRGYALVQNAAGQVVTSRAQLKKNDKISIEFFDGKCGAVIEGD
jgi:exodeoxyribonuclease VII large subunit